ncbi:MAG: hypothetical protein ACYS1A_18435, partial [Planctomycetota bacterium]
MLDRTNRSEADSYYLSDCERKVADCLPSFEESRGRGYTSGLNFIAKLIKNMAHRENTNHHYKQC